MMGLQLIRRGEIKKHAIRNVFMPRGLDNSMRVGHRSLTPRKKILCIYARESYNVSSVREFVSSSRTPSPFAFEKSL